jgi:hypothetical protein
VDVGTQAVGEGTRLFVPEAILPVQTLHPPADRWLSSLCLAILEDALKCVEMRGRDGGPIARARDRREAWAWFWSDAEYCFSFTTVCAVLQLHAEAVRSRLRLAQGGAALATVSRQLRQPLSRVASARVAQRPERRVRRKSK